MMSEFHVRRRITKSDQFCCQQMTPSPLVTFFNFGVFLFISYTFWGSDTRIINASNNSSKKSQLA